MHILSSTILDLMWWKFIASIIFKVTNLSSMCYMFRMTHDIKIFSSFSLYLDYLQQLGRNMALSILYKTRDLICPNYCYVCPDSIFHYNSEFNKKSLLLFLHYLLVLNPLSLFSMPLPSHTLHLGGYNLWIVFCVLVFCFLKMFVNS